MSEVDRTTGLVGYSGMKVPVRVATTAAITLSGEQTIDGVAVVTGDRVLVKDQASGVDNGIYVCDTGTWDLAKDADGTYDYVFGTLVPVAAGSANGGSVYRLTTFGTITPGTSSLVFAGMALPGTVGADVITFLQAGTGAINVFLLAKLREYQRSNTEFASLQVVTDSYGNAYGNGAGGVFIPPGTVSQASTVSVNNQTGFKFEGAGKFISYVNAAAAFAQDTALFKFINGAYCSVKEMTITGRRSATIRPPIGIQCVVQVPIQPTPQGMTFENLFIDGGARLTLTVSGAANNGSGAVRLTLNTTTGVATGHQVAVGSVLGTIEANGVWGITVIDATHVDLVGSTFANAYTSGGTLTSYGLSRGIDFEEVTTDANNDRAFFKNVDVSESLYGIAFGHYNSLVHQIYGGVIGYCGIGIGTNTGQGGSFSANGVCMIGNQVADFKIGDNSTHSIDITNCKSEATTGKWLECTVTTGRQDINMQGSTYHGTCSEAVVDYRGSGMLTLRNCQLQVTGATRKIAATHASSVLTLDGNFFDIDSIEYAGTLKWSGNKYAGGMPTLTPTATTSRLINLDEAGYAPVTETGASRTVGQTDANIICNRAGTITLTLPNATLWTGREIYIRTITGNTVVSAGSDVVPLTGAAAGTAILPATDGAWAILKSDGTAWQIKQFGIP